MRALFLLLIVIISTNIFGQRNPNKKAKSIVEEGKLLYKSEMASWYGTDIFLNEFKTHDSIGGYFSYQEQGRSKCIFFSRAATPKVIGTISFDETYREANAKIDLARRNFTDYEHNLYIIRKTALNEIRTDTLFKRFNNTSLNVIPLVKGKDKKVYVLTGPTQNGVVIFGNDYLLTFDGKNRVKSKVRLHKNIIPINYENEDPNMKTEETMHSHLPSTGDFITATDICTLMLYEKFAKWKSHRVVSKKYLNVWNCETDQLTIISMKTIKAINKDQDKRKAQETQNKK